MKRVVALSEHTKADPRGHPELRCGPLPSTIERRLVELSGKLDILQLRDGLLVRTGSYVGTVDLGELTIQVVPKIAPDVVATLLQFALDLDQVRHFAPAQVSLAPHGFVDIVGMQLLHEVDRLIRSGIFQEYRTRSDDLSAPKGRIRFTQLVKTYQPGRLTLPCEYQDRTPNIVTLR
ncbi:MAG: 5-methylcytosine restriction system specificity protein McrC [Candidatus Xenobia bacterium]